MRRILVALLVAAGLAGPVAAGGATAEPDAGIDALLVGGDFVTIGSQRCVIGFNARQPRTLARYIITSGPCVGGTGRTGLVAAPAGSTSTPYVRGSGGALLTLSPDLNQAPIGSTVCMSGPVSGFRCGTVTAYNVTVVFPGGTVTGLARTSVCAQPGEAGAPFVWLTGGRVIAQGTLAGASGACTTYFQPVVPVLQKYGVVLYTGSA